MAIAIRTPEISSSQSDPLAMGEQPAMGIAATNFANWIQLPPIEPILIFVSCILFKYKSNELTD